MRVSTPCRSQSCSARIDLVATIGRGIPRFGEDIDRAMEQEGWKKIITGEGKTAWLCPRCKEQE